MSMYIWEVKLEVEWKYVTKSGKKSETWTDTEPDEEYVVAAPSGLQAIEVAKKCALNVKERGYEDDWSCAGEVTTAAPTKVLDVVGLELKDCLDG